MVGRVAALGGALINYVPTHYWKGGRGQPVTEYCYMDSSQTCIRFDPASAASFRSGMELCFRQAIAAGLGISLVPHLDDGGSSNIWRNGLVFSPKTKYGGMSYQEVMLNPLADALAAAIVAEPAGRRGVPIRFALQGEMSATVLRFPAEYAQLHDEMRDRILRGMARLGASPEQLAAQREVTKVGVSFNFNRLLSTNPADADSGTTGSFASNILALMTGGNNIRVPGGASGGLARLFSRGLLGRGPSPDAVGEAEERSASSGPDGGLGPELDQDAEGGAGGVAGGVGDVAGVVGGGGGRSLLSNGIDLAALADLFERTEFLGVSAYAPLAANFEPEDLQASMATFYLEMRDKVGLDVVAIIDRRNRQQQQQQRLGSGAAWQGPAVELHYSEFGVGGGTFSGVMPALTPAAAANAPYFGMPVHYRPNTDPWANGLMRDFLRSFYSRSLSWLSRGGGPLIPISHCFAWNMASWDVLGIYPESTNSYGSYRDPTVADMVVQHNRRVREWWASAPASSSQPQEQPQPPVAK
ncbi:hypothetical protein GPECTOR_113g280 [Gonium pectorale]|uniref:Uncharacterized protein n=1 Tax=Gonium pectorale TaxID=33097 RepID=A0A150FZ53_GONPE|nr:hypothetical protein GPECTOR_113g280 [Gonium pectorale]|eukprot:KXZ42868.1 hypothetical protein GPECTOR_113g280 [Gonium pectorale]